MAEVIPLPAHANAFPPLVLAGDGGILRRPSAAGLPGGTSKRSVLEQAAKLEAWAEPKSGTGSKRQKK